MTLKRKLIIIVPLFCLFLLGVLWYVGRLESAPARQPWDDALMAAPEALPPALQAEQVRELVSQSRTLLLVKQQLDSYQEPVRSLSKEATDSVRRRSELRTAIETRKLELPDLQRLFPEVAEHWRAQVVRAETASQTQPNLSPIPPLPPFDEETYAGIAQTREAQQYMELYRESYALVGELRRKAVNAWRAEVAGEFLELLRWQRLRSEYLAELIRQDAPGVGSWSADNLATMQLEASLVKYRYSVLGIIKQAQVEQGVGHGLSGWLLLLRGATSLLLAVLGPLVAFLLLSRLSTYFRVLLEQVETLGTMTRWAPLFLGLLPWFGLLLVLNYEEQALTANEMLFELSIIPAVGKFYALYRLLSMVLRALLNYAMRGVEPRDRVRLARKVRITSTTTAALFALYALVRYAVYISVGRGLLYWATASILPWSVALLFCTWSIAWRHELPFFIETVYGRALSRKCRSFSNGLQGIMMAPVALALVLLGALGQGVIRVAIRFDWFNRVLAGVLRQRLGAAPITGPRSDLPVAYLEAYHLASSSIEKDWGEGRQVLRDRLEASIQAWLEGNKGGEFLIVSGNRGSGRSAVLAELAHRFGETLDVVRVKIPARTLQEAALAECLGLALGVEPSDSQSLGQLAEHLQDRDRTLILVEDVQNVFLAQVGGFEAFLALSRFLRSSRCLFCLSFDREAWIYLDSAFLGQVITPEVFTLPKWSAEALRKQILARHERTGFVLHYDDALLKATLDPEDLPNVERAFFHLLWDQSDGNPGVAEALWFESLCAMPGNDELSLRVGPPPERQLDALDRLNDNSLFLLAALLRHESLTAEEAEAATSLSRGFVQTAINHGLEFGLLERTTSDRIRVQLLWTVPLTRHLRRRNFLYG